MTEKAPKAPKAKAKTYTKKATKVLTLNEFRAWLSGVEEMQADNWHPDPQQWKTIRAKLEDVIENPRAQAPRNAYDEEPRFIRPSGPSMLTAAPPQQLMQNPNRPMETMVPGGGQGRDSPVARIKTPDIDSTGGYQPAFE